MIKDGNELCVSEKYRLYEESVQCHETDIDFINAQFKNFFGFAPKSLREDFGGTAALACDWTKQSIEHKAWSIDLDPEPIKYGLNNHYQRLNDEEKQRMIYIEDNVLNDFDFKVDVVAAFNFSYFIFKKRAELVNYFKKVRAGLNPKGAFFIDLFGGTEAREMTEEETEHENFSYFWDCDSYNPLTDECTYKIHFKIHETETKYEDVFVYNWRMWGVQELREILADAGFSKTYTYWEGTDEEDGSGDGNFFITDQVENCESWVSYIAAIA